jgi:hypothetical protein
LRVSFLNLIGENEMSMQSKKTVADGEGTALADLLFVNNFPATVVVNVSAGVCDVEYSCDKASDLKVDPVTGRTWIAWDFGQVAAGTPGVNSLVAPVTALRMKPVGGIGTMNVVADSP